MLYLRYINEIRRASMKFAEEIKELRQKCLLSQVDFAKEIGVSFSTINRWETGKAKPNYKTLKRIYEYCKNNAIAFAYSEMLQKDK